MPVDLGLVGTGDEPGAHAHRARRAAPASHRGRCRGRPLAAAWFGWPCAASARSMLAACRRGRPAAATRRSSAAGERAARRLHRGSSWARGRRRRAAEDEPVGTRHAARCVDVLDAHEPAPAVGGARPARRRAPLRVSRHAAARWAEARSADVRSPACHPPQGPLCRSSSARLVAGLSSWLSHHCSARPSGCRLPRPPVPERQA